MSRKKKQQREPSPEELRAAEIVAAELGVTLTPLDVPPRQNFADFTIQADGQLPGVIEVTRHADPVRLSLNAAMRDREQRFPRSDLTALWCVYLPPLRSSEHRRYADVVADIENIVLVLKVWEARGELHAQPTNPLQRNDREILHRLGVDWVIGATSDEPGVYFIEPGDGGASGTPAAVAAGLSEARKPDNQRKLEKATGDSDASSRHLFVWLTSSRMLPYFALMDRKLPTTAPDLPAYVTDLWIAGGSRSNEVVWHWDGRVWSEVTTSAARSADGS